MRRNAPLFISALLALAILPAAAAQGNGAEAAYFAAHEADVPLRNLVYLALRLAGVVWIAVEWVAALYLIRAFALLRRHVESRAAAK
jgi:hypothetical protein